MSSPGVSKSVNRSLLVDATFFECSPHCLLERVFRHVLSRVGGMGVIAPLGRKEPEGVAMSCPVMAKEFESSLRQRDVAIFAALATPDVKHHP